MKIILFTVLLCVSLSSTALAEVTYSKASDQTSGTAEVDATQAIEDGYGLTPADFGLVSQDGLGLSKDEIEAIKKMRSGENDPGFTQKENDPSKQIYRGAEQKSKKFEPKRTHRMYEDTRY